MKTVIYSLLIICLVTTGCVKDPAIPLPGEKLPFENDNLKLEIVSAPLPTNIIRNIYFFNASTVLTITYDGKIYKTIDGGITWTLKYSNPILNQPFYQIYFVDANVGYVVGGSTDCNGAGCIPPGGVILKTTDAGNSWTRILENPSVKFISIAANSKKDLFVISKGRKGKIFKSTNAGINWTNVDSTTFPLVKITFNNNFGFCTGEGGEILRSSDNGTTWALSTTLTPDYLNDLKFNSGNGFCINNSRTIWKTTDNGDNWIQKFHSDYSYNVVNPLTTNSCLVFGSGQYSGGDYGTTYGAISQTKNSGDDWVEKQFNNIEPIYYTSFYSTTNGYAVSGRMLISVTVK